MYFFSKTAQTIVINIGWNKYRFWSLRPKQSFLSSEPEYWDLLLLLKNIQFFKTSFTDFNEILITFEDYKEKSEMNYNFTVTFKNVNETWQLSFKFIGLCFRHGRWIYQKKALTINAEAFRHTDYYFLQIIYVQLR